MHKKPAPGYDVKEFLVQTSEFKKLGLEMKFFVDCNGREVEGKQCPTLKEGQKVNFKIKVTLLECRDGADVAISVGVYGYTTVSALYITPLCGCECEKPTQQASSRFHEKNSPLCHQHGNLICGQCVCESTRGGDRCECPLASYGVKNAMELEDRCRESPVDSVNAIIHPALLDLMVDNAVEMVFVNVENAGMIKDKHEIPAFLLPTYPRVAPFYKSITLERREMRAIDFPSFFARTSQQPQNT
ncbi:hypothetical protein RB195_026011 [Necator americanus]